MNTLKKEIDITEKILKLSQEKKLIWQRDELGYFHSSHNKLVVKIEFFNFHRMDNQSSDDSCGTISIDITTKEQEYKIGFDFSVGTRQFSNLKTAISSNFKDWNQSLISFENKYSKILEYIESL